MSVLAKLAQIRGVTWEWNEQSAALGLTPGSRDAGVIAQEVEAVFPHLVIESGGIKRVNYTGLIGVLVEAVKELQAENEALRRRIEAIERTLAERALAERP